MPMRLRFGSFFRFLSQVHPSSYAAPLRTVSEILPFCFLKGAYTALPCDCLNSEQPHMDCQHSETPFRALLGT